jgi:radical SAM superfamily enzyme YgiQ (UPF0313 family)
MSNTRVPSAMHPLSFSVLAGLTPDNIEMELFDEFIEEIPENLSTDLAALTVQTFTAARAYKIADTLRSKGITVVMGGYHPTFLSEEVLTHADAVVVGEAETVWRELLEDFEKHRLKKVYRGLPLQLDGLRYDRSIFVGKKYAPVTPVEFSRGCKLACEFCSVSSFHHHKHKTRPLDNVLEEINSINTKSISIIDDNICADREHAQQFFKELVHCKKKWGGQIGITIAKNDHMLDLIAQSGCVVLMIGFESLDVENLRQMNKRSNITAHDYTTAIRTIKDHGIMVYGSFVLGYDHDDAESIKRTLDFVLENKLFLNNFNTVNPMPGTKLYERLKNENRMIDEKWWLDEKYKYGEIMFVPKRMSAEELKQACIDARLAFNSYSNILKRIFDFKANAKSLSNAGLFLAGNLIARKEVRLKMDLIQ